MSSPLAVNIALRPLWAGLDQDVLGAMLGHMDVGVMLTDLKHTTLAVNHRFGEIFGLDPERAVQCSAEELRTEVRSRIKHLDCWLANLEEVYSDPACNSDDILELVNPHCFLERRTVPVVQSDGQIGARLWTFRDVTQSERLKRVQGLLHEMSQHFDPDPKVVYSRIVRRLSEFYGSTAILSFRVQDTMQFLSIASPLPEVEQMTQNQLADSYCQFCLEAKGPILIQDSRWSEAHNRTLPASVGMTRYAGSPVLDSQGNPIGTLCFLDDRSDELLNEDDLHVLSVMAMRISSELERESKLKSLEQDLAITQAQLIQSEKLAVVGTLAASIAHDIRNIVSAIALDFHEDPTRDSRGKRSIRGHMDRFLILSQRLLSYARPKGVTSQEVNLGESILGVRELLSRHSEVSNVEIACDIAADLNTVRADPERIDHLFINLVLNSLQASRKGDRISITARNEPGGMVAVEVKDMGSGMTQAQINQTFEPFSSTRPAGFGLGLFSCRQIMNECHGSIEVSSQVGIGTSFTARFQPW